MLKLNYAIVMPLIPVNAGAVWIENSAETAFVSLNNAQVYENLKDTGGLVLALLPNESETQARLRAESLLQKIVR